VTLIMALSDKQAFKNSPLGIPDNTYKYTHTHTHTHTHTCTHLRTRDVRPLIRPNESRLLSLTPFPAKFAEVGAYYVSYQEGQNANFVSVRGQRQRKEKRTAKRLHKKSWKLPCPRTCHVQLFHPLLHSSLALLDLHVQQHTRVWGARNAGVLSFIGVQILLSQTWTLAHRTNFLIYPHTRQFIQAVTSLLPSTSRTY